MDVDALNYRSSSLMPLPPNDSTIGSSSKDQSNDTLLAFPNFLVESSEANIWSLPSCSRVHAAIGKQQSNGSILSTDGHGNQASGS
ncbi:hypothetical protein ARMSODRAFT_1073567 [Armillaria solidipes]|uniref:Uncharacterized protein n=1 Tax=Armillaria solidipes TaxID=1076256 RepID=A0A2H3AWB8_9AGAR|nr:hypothetical protein ARMSODRAFT_1073567 [Armillaria solidipes]